MEGHGGDEESNRRSFDFAQEDNSGGVGKKTVALRAMPTHKNRCMGHPAGCRLQQGEEFVDCHLRSPDQLPEGSRGELFVLRYREVGTLASLRHHEVAANLANLFPTRFSECLCGILAGDIGERSHSFSLCHCTRDSANISAANCVDISQLR
jgi:hypothetical protein